VARVTPALTAQRLAPAELQPLLVRLGVRAEDRAALLAHAGELSAGDLDRIAGATAALGARLGQWGMAPEPVFADLADEEGRPRGLLPMMALLASVPEVRDYHAGRGIGEQMSFSGLADLGQQLWVFRKTFGTFGLDTQEWLTCAWGGGLFWFGRLQLNLLEYQERHVASVHIPQTGPLRPEAVDASFDAARDFFGAHFGDLPIEALHCSSWLLDPQLAKVLPATSNMAAFQRRWRLVGEPRESDAATIYFVFRRRPPPGEDLDWTGLPRETTLQRAVLEHLDTGGHWYTWTGLIDPPVR